MKQFVSYSTRAIMILALIQILSTTANAQTTYTISSNASWSSKMPATCSSCTINIGSGVKLTVDESVTCQNCTFTGGTVSVASQTMTLGPTGGSTTHFNGTDLNANGTAKVIANAPISLTNAVFTFNNTTSLTTGSNVLLSTSTIDLYDNSSMTSNGNIFTSIGLENNSRIEIGNGSLTSSATYTVNGPIMTVYDNSFVAVANQDNVFSNAIPYIYLASTSANIFTAKIYNTSGLNMNCGAGYANACSSPSLYGPASVGSGVTSTVTLPIILDGFTAILNSNHTVTLNWNTQMESNFSHFTIERSADGSNWEEIGTVQGVGNSAVQTDYSYTDEQPLTGSNYYRLELVNLDGSYTYSDVKLLQSASIAKVSFFPNPAHDYVNVSLGGTTGNQVTILLSSISGRLMQEKTAVTGNGAIVTFPIQNVAAGMYILTVVNADGTRESSPVLINRS